MKENKELESAINVACERYHLDMEEYKVNAFSVSKKAVTLSAENITNSFKIRLTIPYLYIAMDSMLNGTNAERAKFLLEVLPFNKVPDEFKYIFEGVVDDEGQVLTYLPLDSYENVKESAEVAKEEKAGDNKNVPKKRIIKKKGSN